MPRPRGVWLAPLLTLLVPGCGPGDPPVPPPPEAPAVVRAEPVQASDSEAVAPAPSGPEPTAPVASIPSTDFPHGEHRTVRCRTCHARVTSHATHETVECESCHEVPGGGTALPVRSEEDCLACHHDPSRATPCATCHGVEAGGEVRVTTTLALSTRAPPVERTLTFAHDGHAHLSCETCHTTGLHFEVERSCASCHRPPHQPGADCVACHEPALDRHRAEAHLGCGGAGCHERVDLGELSRDRSVCLICHGRQRSHEEGRVCAECHVTGSGARGAPAGQRRVGGLP